MRTTPAAERIGQRAQHHGAHVVTTDIQNRQRAGVAQQSGNGGAENGKIGVQIGRRRQNQINPPGLQLVPCFPRTEIRVDQIEIGDPDINAGLLAFQCQVDGYFGFTATVVTDNDSDAVKLDSQFTLINGVGRGGD